MMDAELTPIQRRLLAAFVREYEQARDNAAIVQQQADAARRVADAAYQRLLRAGALALGSADVAVDFVTWEVIPRAEHEKVAEQGETR